MFKTLIIAAVFAITPMVLAQESSAEHCSSGYRAYRAPAVGHHGHLNSYRGGYGRTPINSFYGAPYRAGYGGYGHGGYGGYGGYGQSGYGRYGGNRYYGRGTSIGIGRGGISLNFGF